MYQTGVFCVVIHAIACCTNASRELSAMRCTMATADRKLKLS